MSKPKMRMKMWVEEKPERCEECPLLDNGQWDFPNRYCNLDYEILEDETRADCPLRLIEELEK